MARQYTAEEAAARIFVLDEEYEADDAEDKMSDIGEELFVLPPAVIDKEKQKMSHTQSKNIGSDNFFPIWRTLVRKILHLIMDEGIQRMLFTNN